MYVEALIITHCLRMLTTTLEKVLKFKGALDMPGLKLGGAVATAKPEVVVESTNA